ncbi:hypothetical protein ACJMK2_020662 [Sinanodonta woodiana]|uniref:Uncharacterized protein n=1 Tax=Sinanodonta woodiana TaxID=1069815 RepID=A0ABD3U371_SINWO
MDDNPTDSDSDWDSTLDFTSPRQTGGPAPPRGKLEIEEEDIVEEDIEEEGGGYSSVRFELSKPVLKERSINDQKAVQNGVTDSPQVDKSTSQIAAENPYSSVQKLQKPNEPSPILKKAGQRTSSDEQPPYNFRSAMNGSTTPEPTAQKPGKEKKGTVYDRPPSPKPTSLPATRDSFRSSGSWDDTEVDADQTLKELRETFHREKRKEQAKEQARAREDLKLKLDGDKSQTEEPQPTNRSEVTWKSWASNKFSKKQKGGSQSMPAPPMSSRSQNPQPLNNRNMTLSAPIEMAPSLDNVASPEQVEAGMLYDPYLKYYPAPVVMEPDEEFEEPKKLYVKDEDRGRYLYYFGYGHKRYYEVNEELDEAVLPGVADSTEKFVRRAWQEFFALLRIITSIFIWFLVELFRFLAHHIIQPIVVGIFLNLGDYLVKPLLSTLFNGFVQPCSTFWWNVFSGMKHMFGPIGEILNRVFTQFAMLFRSIRFFEIHWNTGHPQQYHPIVQTV